MCYFIAGKADGTDEVSRTLFCGTWEELVDQSVGWARLRGLYVQTIQQCFRGLDLELVPSPLSVALEERLEPGREEREAS